MGRAKEVGVGEFLALYRVVNVGAGSCMPSIKMMVGVVANCMSILFDAFEDGWVLANIVADAEECSLRIEAF